MLYRLVIDALGQTAHPTAGEALQGLRRFYSGMSLQQPTFARIAAAQAQVAAKSGDVQSLAAELFDAPDHRLRIAAATALGTVGGNEAVQALITALADPWEDVRNAAAEALGQIGSEALPAVLDAFCNGHNHREREYSAMIERAGMSDVWGADRQEKFVRRHAAVALGEIGGEAATTALIAALYGSYTWVKPDSAKALAKIGGTRAIGGLRDALPGADPFMQVEISRALEAAQRE